MSELKKFNVKDAEAGLIALYILFFAEAKNTNESALEISFGDLMRCTHQMPKDQARVVQKAANALLSGQPVKIDCHYYEVSVEVVEAPHLIIKLIRQTDTYRRYLVKIVEAYQRLFRVVGSWVDEDTFVVSYRASLKKQLPC